MVLGREVPGLSQREAALGIGVDPGTLARWERGEWKPSGELIIWVKRFLDDKKERPSYSRRVG